MIYSAVHFLMLLLVRLLFRLRTLGVDQIPREGGVILAANHVSYWDIPLLVCALQRRVDFMGKEELFRVPLVGRLFRSLGAFPVRRGVADRHAMEEAVRRLRQGRVVAIYPEGSRSKDGNLRTGKSGVGRMVAQSGAPVVPAYIHGTWKWWRFHRVTVIYGAPMDFSQVLDKRDPDKMREVYAEIAQAVMAAVASLRPNPMQGGVLPEDRKSAGWDPLRDK